MGSTDYVSWVQKEVVTTRGDGAKRQTRSQGLLYEAQKIDSSTNLDGSNNCPLETYIELGNHIAQFATGM